MVDKEEGKEAISKTIVDETPKPPVVEETPVPPKTDEVDIEGLIYPFKERAKEEFKKGMFGESIKIYETAIKILGSKHTEHSQFNKVNNSILLNIA